MAGLTSPFLGVMLDRVGTRVIGTVLALVAGFTTIGVGFVHDLWLFYLLFAISGVSGFGNPSGQLLTVVPVAKWFQVKRGRALAFVTLGTPLGNLLLIPLAQVIIEAWGWRTAWIVLGSLLALGAAPICALFMRKDPESMGLAVDGLPVEPRVQRPDEPRTVVDDGSWTVHDVLRNRVFWLLLIATALGGAVTQGTLVHRVPFWQDEGLASGYVAIGAALAPLLVVMSGLACGFLAERWAVRSIGFAGALVAGLSAVPMIFAQNSIMLLAVHNILWGIGQGANNTIANVIWPNYFGRRFLGSIRGIIFPISIGTAALSAPLFGVLLSELAEPRLAWTVTLGCFFASGVFFLVSRPPLRRKAASSEQAPAAVSS